MLFGNVRLGYTFLVHSVDTLRTDIGCYDLNFVTVSSRPTKI